MKLFAIENIIRRSLFSCTRLLSTLSVNSDLTMNENKVTRKPRYDGRTKKRQWEERRSDKGAGLDPTLPKLMKIEQTEPISDKIKRRKFVILMGYSGVGYYGMQRNPNTKTVEEDLLNALLETQFITQDSFDQVQNMHYQRAARTDKGVSAARQVVSLKLSENFDIAPVNEKLPEQIRLFGFKRVTKGFNAKSQCDGRTYLYVLPTIAFADANAICSQKDFRISDDKIKEINDVLKLYEGTKNFHNFTSKKKAEDPSAKRFIRSFVCEPPFIKEDVEFCTLKVYGQSFMLHQIRKMVGMLLAVLRGLATQDIIIKALSTEKLNVPRAPGLGLLLDYVHYERYNYRYGEDGMHEKLTWDEVEKDVKEFKENHILPVILDTEIKEEAMVWWLQNKLVYHSYDDVDEKNEESDDEKNEEIDDENNADNVKNDEFQNVVKSV
ncbi:hypothetical protein ABEB36_005276 [Hypothenemus hampei]|uniref:Pseudouridylate synthase 1 homolog n=2 Tax=Hypothenemus hampei TaxID=57062 RepID=A0ABD1EY18_HYPHA